MIRLHCTSIVSTNFSVKEFIMVMQSMRSGKGSGLLKTFFLSLLALAAGGLVLTDVGGFFRDGVQSTDVAQIGNRSISIQQFDRDVRRSIGRLGITPQQAYEMGYIQQILQGELQRQLLSIAAEDLGLRVGEQKIAEQINEMISPMATEEQSKKDVLKQILLNQGMSEGEFVKRISNEVASNLLTTALQNTYLGNSETLAQTLYQFQNESRDIEYISMKHDDFELEQAPTEEQLKKFYAKLIDTFAIPEKRTIEVGIIEDENLKKTIEITQDQIKDFYEDEIDAYKIPEQRILEQALVDTQDKAQKILDKINAGKSLKLATESVADSANAYIESSSFEKEGLLEDLQDPIFNSQELPAKLGPFKTPLGWHVIVVNEIKDPKTKSFDEVKDSIEKELMTTALADQKFELAGVVDDLSVGGASLQEMSEQIPMDIKEYKDITSLGAMASRIHPLDDFGDDQSVITETAFVLFENEASEVIDLSDGRQAVVYLKSIQEKSTKPFEEVSDELKDRWIKQQKRFFSQQTMNKIQERIALDEISFKDAAKELKLKVKTQKEIKRDTEVKAPLVTASVPPIFKAMEGDNVIINTKNGIGIAHIKSVKLPEISEKSKDDIQQIQDSLMSSTAEEIVLLYLDYKRQNTSVSINQRLLDQVYGQPSN